MFTAEEVGIKNDMTARIEEDLIALLDDWFSLPETWDNELDEIIAEWYSNPPNVFPKYPYFSPSSLDSCPRELYLKAKGAKKDMFRDAPHRGRWRKLGTLSGDLIQRELLAIERNYERLTGITPKFRFLRNEDGTPMFEEFVKKNHEVMHNGETFYLFGLPDGIMEYTTDEGEKLRVGLEIKSKQGTPARTSVHSMKGSDKAHAIQTVAYAEMYDCDYYVILYINLAKQSWNMTAEQYAKTPDIRAFCSLITDLDKAEAFDLPAMVTKSVREDSPPPLDITKFTFNNFKTACAKDLSDEELATLSDEVDRILGTRMVDWKKRAIERDLEMIVELAEDVKVK